MAFTIDSIKHRNPSRIALMAGRFAAALAITVMLLVFLVISRWMVPRTEILTLRPMSSTDSAVANSTPPPPPPQITTQTPPPPPSPAAPELPKLELSINDAAPPIQASLDPRELDLTMKQVEFSKSEQLPKAASLFAASQLDGQPRLINRPYVPFPAAQSRKGTVEGRVTLDVVINAGGRVSIRRVVSSSHPDFVAMAKEFATKAKFSPPMKDGRIVSARFQWPLVLRP